MNISVFDISFNQLDDEHEHLCHFLETNLYVNHLDLSGNRFSHETCQDIKKSLSFNNSIFGLHFSGMFGKIDQQQNLIINHKFKNNQSCHLKRVKSHYNRDNYQIKVII